MATELGVSAMALYHHVADRDALVAAMIDAVLDERPMPPRHGDDWRDDIWTLAEWMRAGMGEHPAMPDLLAQNKVLTPAMSAIGDRWHRLWRESGLDAASATHAARASLMGIVGALKDTANDAATYELFVRALIDGLHSRLVGVA